VAHYLIGDLALELGDGADLVPAIVAFHVSVVVLLPVKVEAVAAAFAAFKFDSHSRTLRKGKELVHRRAGLNGEPLRGSGASRRGGRVAGPFGTV